MKYRIKKDDKVRVVAGKDKGKIGKVLKLLKDKSRIVVEGINKVKRHSKPTMKNNQGGIIEKEAPIDISNVMVVCNSCLKPARVKIDKLEDGTRVRKCHKCNESIETK